MVDISTIVTAVYELYVYHVFGSPILAGIFGFVFLFLIAVKMGLGADSLIVLGIFSSIMFSAYVLQIDFTIMVALALSFGIISSLFLWLVRR